MRNKIWLLFLVTVIWSCESSQTKKEDQTQVLADKPYPFFSADSAYSFVQKQVDFGPRVPGTPGHDQTKIWLISKLKYFGFEVQTQEFEAKTYDGLTWNLSNIIASYNPEATKRVLLAAHWDTRRIADKDTERIDEPIDGANDGGSGVGVLLEIARVMGSQNLKPSIGIDIIFFDGEDDGEPDKSLTQNNSQIWWCLGSQYWSKNKHQSNYSAYYGILIDLVGGKNARFYREGHSRQFAAGILKKVWSNASKIGHGDYFVNRDAPEILDDHYFVNQYGGIPMIDILEFSPDYGFGLYHHTHSDAMDLIDRKTLKAVGETVLFTIYQE